MVKIEIGQSFEHLTVLKESRDRGKSGVKKWICRCDCKKIVTVRGDNLKNGNTKSCGCLKEGYHG